MELARQSERSTGKAQEDLLDELDKAMSIHFKTLFDSGDIDFRTTIHSWYDAIPEDYNRAVPWHDTFLAFTIRHGLTLYVSAKFNKFGRDLIKKDGRPLLDYACRPEPQYSGWDSAINPVIVEILLQNGADPNEKFNGFSPWQNALYNPTRNLKYWLNILKLLIAHGADPNSFTERHKRLRKRKWQKRRYSALYTFLAHAIGESSHDGADQETRVLLNEVAKLLRDKGALTQVFYEIVQEDGTSEFEELFLTKEDAPFLEDEDIKGIKKRTQQQTQKKSSKTLSKRDKLKSTRQRISRFFKGLK